MLRLLDSSPRGLVEKEAEERLTRWGENTLPEPAALPWLRRFGRGLRDPFTAVLLCLALVSAAVASWGIASVILFLVGVSCGLRATSEYRADVSAAALCDRLPATATVQRRPGPDAAPRVREIPSWELVPGDVVRLGPGDVVPADIRLLRAARFHVHQAALTGESAPVAKYPVDAPPAHEKTTLPARAHLVFQGSSVVSGSGVGLVVATGADTQYAGHGPQRDGAIWRRTAFDRSVHRIAWILIRFMLLTPPLVLLVNALLRDRGLETLPFAVAVAVSLTPEMLPVIVTTALARGATSLARDRNVIVRRLSALHDLGAMDVLCTDKTGTLTQDRPVVAAYLDAGGHPAAQVLHWGAVNSLWTLQLADPPAPDPLDDAVLEAAEGMQTALLGYEGVAALPFEPERRIATAVVGDPGRPGTHIVVVKGAVGAVLDRCTRVLRPDGEEPLDAPARDRLAALADQQAGQGLRLLAVARAERPARLGTYAHPDEHGLTFLGLLAFHDQATQTAGPALAELGERGVTVKVLTGDHAATAARACRDLGLAPGAVVDADRIDGLSDGELAELATAATVFARCTPAHKARIVRALGDAGHVTGYLGDGLNDLPALRAADVALAPQGAVDVTRQSADVVLAAKDLTAIGHAITTGRYSSSNITTYLRITLSSNLGNVVAMLTAALLLPFLPMLPAQVLAQNLCFDAAQLSLAFDRPSPAALRHPRALHPRDFLRFVTGFGALNAVADLATFAVLVWAVRQTDSEQQAAFHTGWFTENLLTQALVMLMLRTACAPPEGRAPLPLRLAAAALAAIGLALPLSPLGSALGMSALPPAYYLILAAVLALYAAALALARNRYRLRATG
ncbi:magnesium-translocating P-type ATPase [Streptomyces sp. NPDC004134]|uniref:magnesium-translocating P-type ATPase n=1 Tax=Streptomyces sp. NPDC004134 TaxID=3364691 RepID=UPI00367F44F0